jgi:hypothetical protein
VSRWRRPSRWAKNPPAGSQDAPHRSISDRAEAAITTGSTFTLTVECVDQSNAEGCPGDAANRDRLREVTRGRGRAARDDRRVLRSCNGGGPDRAAVHKQGLLGDVYENARVLSEDYDATGRIMKVRGLPGAIARLRRTLAASWVDRRLPGPHPLR